jgi:hypothetical protein
MSTHHIKCDTEYLNHLLGGIKPFEVRKNDRAYQAGDHLMLTEVTLDERNQDLRWAS